MPLCAIEGCGQPIKARGWCQMHYNRWYSTGDPLSIPTRQKGIYTDPYTAAHALVYKARGPARDYYCVDCGEEALDWSFTHQEDPLVKFSFNLDDYLPRCRRCHRRYDLN